MENDERKVGPDFTTDGGSAANIKSGDGESDGGSAEENRGSTDADGGKSGGTSGKKRGRPRRDAGGDSAGYVHVSDIGKRAKPSKDGPNDLRHATALLVNLTAAASGFSNIPAIKLEISECEMLVKAIDEFIRVWFPNAGKKIFDEKTSSAIALGFAVVSIVGSRVGASVIKAPAPAQAEPEIDWKAMSEYNVPSI